MEPTYGMRSGTYSSYAEMVEDAHDVEGWHGLPSPLCGRCGTRLRMALFPVVRWVCPGPADGHCVRWAWVEPGDGEMVWPEVTDPEALAGLVAWEVA